MALEEEFDVSVEEVELEGGWAGAPVLDGSVGLGVDL